MIRRNKKLMSILMTLCIVISGMCFSYTKALAAEVQNAVVNRIGGQDRYETSANLALSNWDKSENIVLVSGEGYADALSASVLAKKLNAPILLTTSDKLEDKTRQAIQKLSPKNIYIIGGEGVISFAVRSELKTDYKLIELKGKDRFETNVKVAEELINLGVTPTDVIVANGREGFADALSVAPIAASEEKILLLVSRDSGDNAFDFIQKYNSKATVIGTKFVVPDEIYNKLGAVKRVNGGANRFETNLNILREFNVKACNNLYVADSIGDGYADALIASVLAGKSNAPLVLIDNKDSNNTKNALEYIKSNAASLIEVNAVGGVGVIPDEITNSINELINNSEVQPDINPQIKPEINPTGNTSLDKKDKELIANSKEEFETIIKNALENFETQILIKVPNYNEKEYALSVVNDTVIKYPEIDYGYEGVKATITGYSDSNEKTLAVTFEYRLDKATMEMEKEAVKNRVQQILQNVIKPTMSDVQKELALHDYVIKNADYNVYNYENNIICAEDHNAYGVLVKGTGVCESYAKAMYELLNAAGIECKYVTGYAKENGTKSGGHAWNMVKLDGEWYNLDTTWDDPVSDRTVNGGISNITTSIQYKYFNVTDDLFNVDHIRGEFETLHPELYPSCTATKYSFSKVKRLWYKFL